MTRDPTPVEEPASLLDGRRVDQLCDRFEAAWQEGGRPAPEAFLAEAPAGLRAEALRQLLLLDVDYRRRAGEVPVPDDYLPRFGDAPAVLQEVLGPSGSAATTLIQGRGGDGAVPAIPGYEVLGELGRGGMGVVYKARQVKAGRVVALKVILSGPHAGPEQQARFRTEAEAVARLQHPNIVQIHEVGEHAGRPFFSLEFCAGGSLDARLAGTPLPPREAAVLVEQLARAMHAAHQKGVVHRDLKPANVLLAEDGTPKVSDFGLAKMLGDASGTVTGDLLGTPSYMAPEQAGGRGNEIGPACDVYALGAILYECLTGRPPFKAATQLETVQQVCGQEPVAPRWLNRQLPRGLETICLKCLDKEPQRRYASALDLAEDVRRFLDGAPIRARPPSALRLAVYWLRRHPATAATTAAGVLLAFFITLGAVWHSAQLTVASAQLAAALEGEQKQRLEAEQNMERARQSESRIRQLGYASDVRLANQLLRTGDVYHLSDSLDRQLPADGTDDWREFAWFYARQFSRPSPPPALQGRAQGPMRLAGYSTDGRRLITAGGYGVVGYGDVQVWEMPAGRSLLSSRCSNAARPPYSTSMLAVLYPDGRTLAIVRPGEWVVRLLDVATGSEKGSLQHPAGLDHLALSADGETLATVADGQLRLWDAHSFQPRGPAVPTDPNSVALALSPDGRTLADVPTADPFLVRLWDVSGGIREEVKLDSEVVSLTYSPKGDLLAASQREGWVSLLRTDRGRFSRLRYMEPHGNGVMAFSPDGRLLAIGAADEVRLWNVRDATFRGRLRWQPSGVTALAFSPDGHVLAVGTWDGLVHRVDPDRPLPHETLRADLRPSGPLAVSHDGKTLALPDEDGTVKLVDAGSGEVRLTLPGHGGRIADCAFSPDDRTLATAGRHDAEVRLWDTATGRERKGFRAGLSGSQRLAFSSRGGLLAAGDNGGAVRLWDPAAGDLRGTLPGHGSAVRDLAFAPDGRTLASCDGSSVVRLWDVPPLGTVSGTPRENVTLPGDISAIAFAPTGRTLALGAGNEVHLLEVPEAGPARRVRQPLLTGGGPNVINLAFAPDGGTLLIGYNDERPGADKVYVRDVASGALRASLRDCDLNPDHHCAAWMPDGRLLVQSGGGDVQVRDLTTTSVRVLPRQPPWDVHSLAFSPDGRSLYLGTSDPLGEIRTRQKAPFSFVFGDNWIQRDHKCKGDVADTVRLWDMASLKPGPRLPGEESMALPGRIALSADGRLLAAGGPDGSVRLWDLAARRKPMRLFINQRSRDYAFSIELASILQTGLPEYSQHSEGVESLAFSPDRRWLAAAGERGTVTLWDTDGWQEHHPLAGAPGDVAWVGFGPDSTLAVACKGQVRLCDPRSGEVRVTLGAEDDPPILCGAFAPDGHLLVMGTAAQTIRVWDLPTATERRALTGHMNQVAAVAFSPDGKTLASGDWSGAVKLWGPATLQEVASLEGHRGRVHCLAFSPDGQTLATGAEAGAGRGEVFLWRAPHP